MSEELIVRQCAPTLAGLKTGSLFSYRYPSSEELTESLRRFNRRLRAKGLRMLMLRRREGRALIYVYRPDRLAADLNNSGARRLLNRLGYPAGTPEAQLRNLVRRLETEKEFPHEIGLFLGYPTEDVEGFIDHRDCGCKCVGCWKVYGDEARARAVFERYQKCTAVYCASLARGVPLEKLSVG